VLLSRGIGDLSDLICSVDGGSYSHAALWDGEHVVEATLGGIHANPLAHSLQALQYVDVYRYHRDEHWLGECAWPAEPVVAHARTFIGAKYAYADLLMAAVVISLGRRTSIPAMKLALRRFGAQAGNYLASKLFPALNASSDAKDAMVCTEVVAAAYYHAPSIPVHRYALEVLVRGRSANEGLGAVPRSEQATLEAEYLELSLQWRTYLRAGAPDLARDVDAAEEASCQEGLFGLTDDRIVRAGDRALPLSCVTPRDLETSPSLKCLGRIPQPSRRGPGE
jgi:hypothetical protein